MSAIPKPPLNEPIAIIGSACHFAGGVNNPSELWELLRNPRDIRSEISDSRFNAKRFYHPNHAHHGHSNVMHSYLIQDDIRAFDAEFFGIKPIEAAVMDPQQRVLMETVYESIEAAGMTLEKLKHSDTGVFVGAMCADYEAMQFRDLDAVPTYLATGSARSILSNRISYFFDWHGPSMTIDTACSSSLVAVHLATKALRSGESKMAVVGGSNLILGPESYIMESKLKMLSPDGIGRMWDKDANGYARGDGVAAIVLKTLSSAIADGDHIECVIRETGVNQDGTTTGITMPSVTAQQALIERTYAKAGLDLHVFDDQPQIFEAHGTGTPAGDPIEAEAISRAFTGNGKPARSPDDPLFVGSFKTILGHTEGTAGIAAILKASLEIQHGQITPNLHFETLSPAVASFYGNLQIPKEVRPWPRLSNSPRRVSVNSFGFGGTNAHAILESYEAGPHRDENATSHRRDPLFNPFLFSAASDRSLRANLQAFATYLVDHTSCSAHDLNYTLSQRRSAFLHRVAYPSSSLDDLRTQILSSLEDQDALIGAKATKSTNGSPPKILGIFTGQGAQYPRMGESLINNSPTASRIIEDLESHLLALPDADRPTWSLRSELLASKSRVHEAAISQPLCTAIQILIVDLLQLAKVKFDVVVGHSSGEIAAAYAAGYLTARDAILIAYYRGLHCKHASSPNKDVKGAMLAVGTSFEDAIELCEDDLFAGRISVAACNSSTSVTISGDEDAIDELEDVLEDEGKFHRRLRVDQAYHSSHMLPCAPPYVESLLRAGVKHQTPPESKKCLWYSSVCNGNLMDTGPGLEYWAENMVKPVLFNQALTTALADHANVDVVLEVGSHPALKGPASQSISEALKYEVPYHGSLNRNIDAIQAMSKCLGFLWSNLGNSSLDLYAYEAAVAGTGEVPHTLVKGLPSYQWDHGTIHWQESRRSRRMRLSNHTFHQLLGDESPDSSPHHLIWKSVLKPSEIPWLEGHQVEGQIVFPAAGYVSTAIEAGKFLATGKEIRLIELSDFSIQQAITFEENNSAIEVLTELSQVTLQETGVIRATFTYSAALGTQPTELTLVASADLRLVLGSASLNILPERGPPVPHLINVEPRRLYDFMESLGYNFSGAFRALKTLKRKLGRASCELPVQMLQAPNEETPLLIHPTEIDAAFQSIILAYSYPGDDKLRSLHLPASISKIRVNPALCALRIAKTEHNLIVDSKCLRADRATPSSGFSGHFDMYFSDHSSAALQVDGVRFIPFAGVTNKDRNVFHKIEWVLAAPDGSFPTGNTPATSVDHERFRVLSRIACFYLRKFDEEVPVDSPSRFAEPLCHYLNYAHHMTELLRNGKHRYAKGEWIADTLDDVMEDVKQYGFSDNADVKIMLLVGETMPRVFAQETTMIEHMRTSGLLDEYYADGFGTKQSVAWLGNTVKQITDRHPHLNILEIGAGTGGATKSILKSIGRSFDSYTFTDISSSFFENAAELFSTWRDCMVFKVYDAERDPADQGFDGTTKYDVVVVSLVIHATAELDKTMRNLRKLLKPGGYLVVAEGSSDGPLQSGDGFIFGGLPGWWLGVKEGRVLSPFINTDQWDSLLKRTGFSGIDGLAPPEFLETFGLVLFVSQAVDDRISFLRHPLAVDAPLSSPITKIAKLVIIGGVTEPVSTLASQLGTILENFADQLFFYRDLGEIDHDIVNESSTVISLVDLDAPTFSAMTPESWSGFRRLFEVGKTLLWISTGRLADKPLANMPVGFGRSALNETPGLHAQFLDFPTLSSVEASIIAESLLRMSTKDLRGDDFDDLLWTVEPELVMDNDGRYLVPRINPITTANKRYNSIQRPIFHEVDVNKSPVELHQTPDDCIIKAPSRYDAVDNMPISTIKLKTTYTVLSALKTDAGHRLISLGVDTAGHRYLSLVSRPISILEVPREHVVPFDIKDLGLTEAGFLTLVASHLIALVIVAPLLPGQTVMLHNAPLVIANAVEIQAFLKNITIFCTTDIENGKTILDTWVRLPPYVSRSELSCLFPGALASFVGFSPKGYSENEECILATLPRHCNRQTADDIYSMNGIDTGATSANILTRSLETAVQLALNNATPGLGANEEIVSLASLVAGERPENPIAIIDWTSTSSLKTQVARLDSKPMFKSNRTYWLCGMSGSLGISLCDWMIDRGVTHLVITSRNPKVDESWIEDYRKVGVNVIIMPCDVTNEASLRATHDKIVQKMPPIAGALNGAMVLSDSSIQNMQYDQVMDVIRPKVLGSSNLDQIFHDVNLDFFILVSSINCIVGNVGQANYAAANMYVCSLAAQRRSRGLNATAVNIGAVIGAGYITRETDRGLDNTVERNALMHLSEEDFHQIIAEAIEAGYPDSPSGPEITTGLLDISPDSPNIPKWYSNPRFSRFLVHRTASDEEKKEEIVTASIQDQLNACTTEKDLSLLVREKFGDQLRKILQTPANVLNDEILSKSGKELGLDSLISVDIRSWFSKNFQVSVPVLKIMSNETMADLVQSSLGSVPAELTPQMPRSRTEEVERNLSSSTSDGTDLSINGQESASDISFVPIDWEVETTLPSELANIPVDSSSPPAIPPKVVVLTGATGYLGTHLINHIRKSMDVEIIHCLAVRKLESRFQNGELPTDPRIKYYQGDLSDPLLGLSKQQADSIFSSTDAVIHNGADTSHIKFFADLRAANVNSTIELVRLCLPRRIPFHYISTAGVSIYSNLGTFPPISAAGPGSRHPPADGSFGYACSKWVSERLLELLHEMYDNFSVFIYRPSTIIREGADDATAQAELDWVNSLLRYIRKLGIAPRVAHNHGVLDLVRVETCCSGVLSRIMVGRPKDGIVYVNQCGDTVVLLDGLQDVDANEQGSYITLPLHEWIREATMAGLQPAVGLLIQGMDGLRKPAYPRLLKS